MLLARGVGQDPVLVPEIEQVGLQDMLAKHATTYRTYVAPLVRSQQWLESMTEENQPTADLIVLNQPIADLLCAVLLCLNPNTNLNPNPNSFHLTRF